MRLSMRFGGPKRAVFVHQINVGELRLQQADFSGQWLGSGQSSLSWRAVTGSWMLWHLKGPYW
jgi:hypothetical protein